MQATFHLAQFSHKPSEKHWNGLSRIVHYLAQTKLNGIQFDRNCESPWEFYVDADWAGDILTRRSTTGYIVFLCAGAIAWQSKLQTTVATSSMESEYMAEYAAMQELVWLRGVFKELGLLVAKPTPFFMNSLSAKDLSENLVYQNFHKGTESSISVPI